MDELETATLAQKKPSMIMTVAAIGVVTLLAAGGGWLVGGIAAPKPVTVEEAKALEEVRKAAEEKKTATQQAEAGGGHESGKKEEGLPRAATEANGILQLEPITTNLAYPTENWIRLELALLFNGPPDAPMAEQIHQDIAAYLRTVSLQQIQGPRGFQYLKDDIQERVDLRSEGRVTNIIFRTFVIQ
ncbi:flagellar FliL protein [Pararhizobium capsulatum DSM 1112]|uniref:Flagellar protein FliL n=1 Tax=Pararhizobium capsulatum DSM 1112 TaxID=1121113 RepID=A0ABU0BLN9_9HYPH|nr:flagellar basal body-associated FliL family protein [Pararhizobium capsulatum]MDQ0319158.1 flagellar FliL protein [Pararhizobium capsulatum DSM 1112]